MLAGRVIHVHRENGVVVASLDRDNACIIYSYGRRVVSKRISRTCCSSPRSPADDQGMARFGRVPVFMLKIIRNIVSSRRLLLCVDTLGRSNTIRPVVQMLYRHWIALVVVGRAFLLVVLRVIDRARPRPYNSIYAAYGNFGTVRCGRDIYLRGAYYNLYTFVTHVHGFVSIV